MLLVSGHQAVAAVVVRLDMAVAEELLQVRELHSCRLEEQSPVMPEQRRVWMRARGQSMSSALFAYVTGAWGRDKQEGQAGFAGLAGSNLHPCF